MIKLGINNFFRNLKYFFVPLGTLFLGIIIGFSILIPGAKTIIFNLGDGVKTILNNTSLDFDALFSSVIKAVVSLDWRNLDGAIKTLFDKAWLSQMVSDALYAFTGDVGNSAKEIQVLINDCINSFIPLLVTFVIFTLLGLFGGYFITRMLIRKDIASRSIKRFIVSALIDSLLTATLITFIFWLLAVWSPSFFITTIVSVVLFGLSALVEAYFSQAQRSSFRDIVNVKNSIMLFLANIVVIAIAIVFILLINFIFNGILALFVGIALLEIAFSVVSLNAEAYVKQICEKTRRRK